MNHGKPMIEGTKERAFWDRKVKKWIEQIKGDLKVSQEQTPFICRWRPQNYSSGQQIWQAGLREVRISRIHLLSLVCVFQ